MMPDNIGKNSPLSLMERAESGLLIAESWLWLHEIAELEYPSDETKHGQFEKLLHGLAMHGVLHGWSMDTLPRESYRICPVKNRFTIVGIRIPRTAYMAWRATQTNLPTGSFIHLWLGATPTVESIPPAEPSIPAEPSRPEPTAQPVAIGVKLRPDQQDKLDCQKIARELWVEHPEWRQTDLLKHPRIKSYVTQWKPKTVPGWLSEVDPRPKEQRRGRPKKPC